MNKWAETSSAYAARARTAILALATLLAFILMAASSIAALAGCDGLGQCPDTEQGIQPYPTTIADTMDLASRNQLGDEGPTYPQIYTDYPGPTLSSPYVVPAILLKAIGHQESRNWKQFSADYGQQGPVVINYNPTSCDIGIMQVNSMTLCDSGLITTTAASSYTYNIGAAAHILIEKWNGVTHMIGGNNPAIAEDWYYAVWAYKKWGWVNNPNNECPENDPQCGYAFNPERPPYDGTQPQNWYPYQELIWGWAAHPPSYGGSPFWHEVPLTLPPKSSITNPSPNWIPRPSPAHADPHGSTFLPNVRVNRGDADDQSIISVRNASGDYAAVNITIYDQYGTPWGSSDQTLTADASWFANVEDIADPSISGLYGSAIVGASPDVAVTIHHRTPYDLTAYEGIAGTQRTGVAGFRQTATTLHAPAIYRYYNDWNTSIRVQNAGPVLTEAVITYRWFNNNTWIVGTDRSWIQPGASRNFDQQYNTNLPRGFDGVAEITADQPLAAVVTQGWDYYGYFGRSAYNTFAFGSAPDPQTNDQLNMPVGYCDADGLYSEIRIMNIGQSDAMAEVWYNRPEYCIPDYASDSQSIGAGQRSTFDPCAVLFSGFYGSGRVGPQGSDFVAVVDIVRVSPFEVSAYQGFDVASASLLSYAPFVKKGQNGDWINVMNTSRTTNAKVKVYFFDEYGSVVTTIVDWICPENSQTFFLPAIAGLPSNYEGSAKIESQTWWSPPPPEDMPEIAAVVNRVASGVLIVDDLASYGCFNR